VGWRRVHHLQDPARHYRITPMELQSQVDLPPQKWADLSGTLGSGGSDIVITEDARFLPVAEVAGVRRGALEGRGYHQEGCESRFGRVGGTFFVPQLFSRCIVWLAANTQHQ
jgi:hypothetical protein